MKKERIPIPNHISAKVQFDSDRTCCFCRAPNKTIQIHHIDDDPGNNDDDNLAVLCLECHNKTKLFGRHLNAAQIRLYRNDWVLLVAKKHSSMTADQKDNFLINAFMKLGDSYEEAKVFIERVAESERERHKKLLLAETEDGKLARLLMDIPIRRRKLYAIAQPIWDRGCTADTLGANGTLIEGLKNVMTELTKYFKQPHFMSTTLSDPRGKDYLNERIKSMYEWRRACESTTGNKGRGTIANVILSGSVINDVERMLLDMVWSLSQDLYEFNYTEWKLLWDQKSK